MNKKIIFWMLVMFLLISSVVADEMTEEQINQEIDQLISQGIQKAKEEGKIGQFESYVQSNFGDRYAKFKSQFDAAKGAAPAEGGPVDFAKNNYGKMIIAIVAVFVVIVGVRKREQIVNAVRSPARRMRKEAKEEKKKVIPFIESLDAVEKSKQQLINAENPLIFSIQTLKKLEEKVDNYLDPIFKEFARRWSFNKDKAEKALELELRKKEDLRFRIKEENLGEFNEQVQKKIRQLKKYTAEFIHMLPDINKKREDAGGKKIVLGDISIARKAVNIALIRTKNKELEDLRKILTNKKGKGLKEIQETISKNIEETLEHKEKVQKALIKKRIKELENKKETPKIKDVINVLNKFLQSIEAFKQQRYLPLKELIDKRFLKLLNQEILRIDFISAGENVAANIESLTNNHQKQQQLFEEEKGHFRNLKVTLKMEKALAKSFEEQAEAAKTEITKEDIDSLIDSKKFDRAEKKLKALKEKAKTEEPDKKQLTTVIINDSYEKIIRKMTEEADIKLQSARYKRGEGRKKAFNEVIHILEKAAVLAKENNFPILEAGLKISIDELRKELKTGRLKMPTRGTVTLPKT